MPGLIVALDQPDSKSALELAIPLLPYVDGFKVGLELLFGATSALEQVVDLGLPVFADAKLHDIPATVRGAARQLGRRGARWVTVHLSGGQEMVQAAGEGLAEGSIGESGILGVSVLTSLDRRDLEKQGIARSVDDQVVALLDIADSGGAEGVVCAVHEAGLVKAERPRLRVFTPGVRTRDSLAHDQKRVATVEAAIEAGSDYVVVGRAITAAEDVVAAAAAVASLLDSAGK